MHFFKNYYINVTDEVDIISIVHDLKYAIRDSGGPEGLLTAVVPTSGAALTIMPPIQDALDELKVSLEVFGSEAGTAEDKLKKEREIAPIVQSALLGRTIHLPFQDGKLLIDPFDEVYLLDFDNKKGRREFRVHIISEGSGEQEGQQDPRMQQG